MLQINSKEDFKRIAYAFMMVFNKIEKITMSRERHSGRATIDFWKTDDIDFLNGIHYRSTPHGFFGGLSCIHRPNIGLFSFIDVQSLTETDATFVLNRYDVMSPYKNQNKIQSVNDAKNKLSIIAKLMNLKQINIEKNNLYSFTDVHNHSYHISMRGADGCISYRGDIFY